VQGAAGWGEFAPFTEYDDTQALVWWRAAHESAQLGWPPPVRSEVPVNATVPAVGPDRVPELLARFPGCTTAKVKVGLSAEDRDADLQRLARVREVLGPGGRIRIDVNGGWDLDTAVRWLPRYDQAAGGLEYVEQPCATVAELAALRRVVDVPIAADESIRRAQDPMEVARAGAADIAVLKVAPLGGVRSCLQIAERIGLPVVVSSALETSVGIAAGVALAAALPELPHACGLATVGLFADDVVAEPLLPRHGALPVRRPEPDPVALARVRPSGSTEQWWRDRMNRLEVVRAGSSA